MGFFNFVLLLAFAASPQASGEIEQARRYFEERQWDKAAEMARHVLAGDPKSADAEVLLGLVASVHSRLGSAQTHFERAASLEPENYRTLGYLGATYLRQKLFPEAEKAFREVLRLNPGNIPASYNLGLIALERSAPAEALPHFEAVLRAQPDDSAARIGLLQCQLSLRRTSAARATAQRIGSRFDGRDPGLFQAATMLALSGEYQSAIPLLEKARTAAPSSYEVNYNLALACLRAGAYDRAAEVLTPLSGGSGRAETYDLLGSAEEARGRYAEAIQAFEKAAQAEPANEDYRLNLANAVLQHGSPQAAVAQFERAVRDFPGSWRMLAGLGSARYLAGNYEEAADALLTAGRVKPGEKLIYYLLGRAYEAAPAHQDAIRQAFTAYLRGRPADAWAYYHYAKILRQRAPSNAAEVTAALNRALTLEPGLAEAHLELGVIRQEQGNYAGSVENLERAIRADPALATAHYRLGLAYQKLGQAEKARAELARFRAIKSGKEEARDRDRVFQLLGRRDQPELTQRR